MINIKNLEDAYETLEKCYTDFSENQESIFIDYISDACVKRFEYTLETAWKLAKKILVKNYGKTEQELSINNIFRYMEGYGYAQDWQRWRDYYQKRNDTAHEYSIVKARTLLKLIPEFLKDTKYFINKFNGEVSEN